jgi:LysM repeat protein
MQTLFSFISNKRLQRAGRLALITLLVLATIVAALPQSAQAAACATHYKVKSGDTRASVAHTYNMTWADIAKANRLKSDAILKVGQVLCIPAKKSPYTPTPGTMTASISGDVVRVSMSNFPERGSWSVNVYDTQYNIPGIYKIGRMNVPALVTVKGAFRLPPALRKAPYITVCVRDTLSTQKICRQLYHRV